MAHLLDMSNGRANMAYVGVKPWHELGQELPVGASLDVWCKAAGLDWHAQRAQVRYYREPVDAAPGAAKILMKSDREVLYRSDTGADLGIVSERYKVVQPADILEFFRDIVDAGDMSLETAGCIDGGRKVWALAETGMDFKLKGQDHVKGYLLLATSFDGSLATRAQFTSVRVVCNNTLRIATADTKGAVSVPHSATFDATGTKIELGILEGAFAQFEEQAFTLSNRKMSDREAIEYVLGLMCTEKELKDPESVSSKKKNIVAEIMKLYSGAGYGSDFTAAAGTAWGALNAVTQWVDHTSGNNANNRFRSAQFGPNADLKSKALTNALALVA